MLNPFISLSDVLAAGKSGSYASKVSSPKEDKTLTVPDSDVSVHIPKGPEKPYLVYVSTDLTKCLPIITTNECIVSPVVEVEDLYASADKNQLHTIKIPHCLKNRRDWQHVKVTKSNPVETDMFETLVAKDKNDTKSEGYWVEEQFVKIHTRSFSKFNCSVHKTHCDEALKVFLAGSLRVWEELKTCTDLRVFLCSPLYNLTEYRKVLAAVCLCC